jgi:hypothetical protein
MDATWNIMYKFVIVYRSDRIRFPTVKDFSFVYSVQTDTGAHPASYPMGTGGSWPRGGGIKWQGREADHSYTYSAEVKKAGIVPLLLHTSS